MRFSGLARRLRMPHRSTKGAAEISVVLVAASLVLGVLFGNGLSRTALDLNDGLSWLKDEPSGEVIQVNPATGRPETRIAVGSPGDELDVSQYDGRLVVLNRTTGDLVSFDLATLLASGERTVATGDATEVLVHDGDVFLLDRDAGTLTRIDPVTADPIGEVWVSDAGLVDAQLDDTGTLWVVDPEGTVTGLDWADDAAAFTVAQERSVEGSGPGSVLVGHDRGVTLFGPDQGIVVQVGTGTELVANAPRLAGTVEQPDHSPSDLVPASSPQTGTVVIVGADQVREVDVAAIGCETPGRPVVFHDLVHVPCARAGKVIRLDREGQLGGPDIQLPGTGDTELVLDDGRLLINVQGADRGVQVLPDGSTRTFQRRDESLPVRTVTHDRTGPELPLPDVRGLADRDRDRGRDRTPPPRTDPDRDVDVVSGDDEDRDEDRSGGPDRRTSGPDGGSGKPGNDSGLLPGSDPSGPGSGTPPTTGPPTTPPVTTPPVTTPPVTTPPVTTPPPDPDPEPLAAPTEVTASLLANGSAQVTWSHAGTAATSFVISLDGGGTLASVDGAARQAQVSGLPVGTPSRLVVAARTATETRASAPSNAVTPTDRPGAPTSVTASGDVRITGKIERATYTANWAAAAPNGSPVTQYTVVFTTQDGTRTQTVDGSTRTASVSFGCLYEYNPDCFIRGGSFTVTVTAENALGTGPGVTASGDAGAPADPLPPPPPTLPGAGQQLVASHSHRWTSAPVEGFGETTLTLSPPADWRNFAGSCSYTHYGNRGGVGGGGPVTRSVSCSATTVRVDISTYYIWEPADGNVNHSIVFHASNGEASVDSASYAWTTRQPTLCETCQVP